MITLDPIYRDITSKFNQGAKENEITRTDILIAINDAIAALRNEYVTAGLGQSFAITDSITALARDTTYPFLFVGTLTKDLLKRVAVSKSVINVSLFQTASNLTDTLTTFAVDSLAIKNNASEFKLYKCVKGFTSLNTFTLTFTKSDLRQWRSANGLTYSAGNVIFDGTSYWKLTADLVNDVPYTFVASGAGAGQINATQVYWLEQGDPTINPVFFEFDRINEIRLLNRDGFKGYTIKDNKIYGTSNVAKVNITYVPEWTYVDDLGTNVQVPYELIEPIKQRAIAALATKLRKQSGASE